MSDTETKSTTEKTEASQTEERTEHSSQKNLPSDPNVVSSRALMNKKIWFSRPKKNNPDAVKKLGRIHLWVFYPSGARCAGFLVKRPDIAWMFHRQDEFVAFDGFVQIEGEIVVADKNGSSGRSACKRLSIDLDECVVWTGLPVMCKDGTSFGLVGDVEYDKRNGNVISIGVDKGATANTLLGELRIPADKILGFKRGMGTQLYLADDKDDPKALGALLVDDSVKAMTLEGGVAEKAGAATAVAGDKAKKIVKKVKPKVQKATETVQKATGDATEAAGKAAEKGAFVTGRQIARASGMFGKFADEFKSAYRGEDSDEK